MPSFKIIGLLVLDKKILKVFTIYGDGSHLGHVTWTIYINFRSPSQGGSTYNLALIGQAVSEEKMFKHCWQRQRQRQRRQRTPEKGYTISSPCEPNGSGELINWDLYREFIHNCTYNPMGSGIKAKTVESRAWYALLLKYRLGMVTVVLHIVTM